MEAPTEKSSESEGSIEELEEIEGQMAEIVELVQDAGLGQDVDVVPTEQGYALRISSPVLFDLARAELKPEGTELLGELAQYLNQFDFTMRVEGHTDDVPIKTKKFPSNWELSTARALSVLKFLNTQGIISTRLSAVGYGEFKPLLSNDSPENRQVNRRVEIYIQVKSQDERIELETLFGR